MRKTQFANGEYYHVFNRGVDKRNIFFNEADYLRFLETILFVNNKETLTGLSDYKRKSADRPPRSARSAKTDLGGLYGEREEIVDIVCYCLNPNHYHFILKQKAENGISIFMGKLGNSYTKYFNQKHDRSGFLFQGKFKSTHINTNELLLYLSVYVNANHQIHGYLEKDWPYSSYLDYIGQRNDRLCQKDIIMGQFDNNPSEYEKYLLVNIDYFKEKKELEKYIFE